MDNARSKKALTSRWDNLGQLEAVRVFATVAQLTSFRGAAAALQMPRSTVSRRVADLEAALETRLLQRTTRQVALTDAGEAFMRQISPGLAMIADAGRAVIDTHAEPRGLLRVTAAVAMAEPIGEVLLELVARYPGIRLDLDFTDRQVDLVAEGFDIAVRPGALPDSSLIARSLGMSRAGYFASPAYVKRCGRPKHPRELVDHECIVFSGSSRGARWQFQNGKRKEDVTVPRRIVANNLALVRIAAMKGHGIAWLPELQARDAVVRGKLVPILEPLWPAATPVHLLYPSARHLAPQVRAAIELLSARHRLS